MRLAAALALAGACCYAYALSHSYVDVASLLVFGILGVAAKIFGWNRFLSGTLLVAAMAIVVVVFSVRRAAAANLEARSSPE